MSELALGRLEPAVRAILSPGEVVAAIKSLSDGEKTAIVKTAMFFARYAPFEHRDLVNEAYARAIEGRRNWQRGESATTFLGGVIKSIAWEWKKKWKNEGDFRLEYGDREADVRGTEARMDVRKIIALFDDDPVAQKMVVGMMEGMRGEELQASIALSTVEYESKRKKIRRRIEKLRM